MTVLYDLANQFEAYGQALRQQANSSSALSPDERAVFRKQAKEMDRISQNLSDLAAQNDLSQIQNATTALTESTQTLNHEVQRLDAVNHTIANVAGWIDLGNQIVAAVKMPTPAAFEAILKQLETNLA